MKEANKCENCITKCDGISKGVYNFKNDVAFSEFFEQKIIDLLNSCGYNARKTTEEGYPDIVVCNELNKPLFYIEIKVQRRTFMSVKRILPNADLEPYETLALNLSDLLRYFSLKNEGKHIYILWVLLNRPCLLKGKDHLFYFQSIGKLEKVYNKYGERRKFRRKSGYGDVVNGVHKGVVVNYHFSVNEFNEFTSDEDFIESVGVINDNSL